MKLIFAGTPRVAGDFLASLVSSGHEVVLVITREDAPVGRMRTLNPSDVALVATDLGIPIIKANRLSSAQLEIIANSGAELGLIVAYGSILRADALLSLKAGWYNLHFSLLPKYRGAAPVQRALEAGESETGVTMFKLDEGMDSGLVVGSSITNIGSRENSGDLVKRLGQLAVNLTLELLPRIYSGIHDLTAQSGEPTFARKPTRDDAKVDFNSPAVGVENLILAMNPEPMAWCSVGEEPMRILDAIETQSAVPLSAMAELSPGGLYFIEGKLFAKCGSGSVIELLEVQPSSKRAMSAIDWYNGNRTVKRLL
jgi:methionyl-tRNA formyltransferase